MSSNTKQRPQLPVTKPVTVQPVPVQAPEVNPQPQVMNEVESILVDLGISELIDLDGGYIPSRPELDLTDKAKKAIKRLTLTLDQREARLSDGSIIGTSVSKTIVWLCERFADAI
jgi:hypothetical protein